MRSPVSRINNNNNNHMMMMMMMMLIVHCSRRSSTNANKVKIDRQQGEEMCRMRKDGEETVGHVNATNLHKKRHDKSRSYLLESLREI